MDLGLSRVQIYAIWLAFLAIGLGLNARAALPSALDPDAREGYISELGDEAEESAGSDVVLVPKPPSKNSIPLSDVIWDLRIKKEFIERYRETFGYTEAERNYALPSIYSENSVAQGRSVESDNARAARRSFAEYMFRRLGEHHLDSYFRSDPQLKSVWELKERISNVEVRVSEGFSFMTIYSFSGNYINIRANNPYLPARLLLEMNPASFGPSNILEMTPSVEKQLSRTFHLQAFYKVRDGLFTLVGSKSLAPAMGATLSASTDFLPEGPAPQQNLILAGFSYIY